MKRKRGGMRMKRGIGKRISKSAMSLVLVCIMLFGVVDVTAYAAEVVDSGDCGAYGDNVIWELDSDGKLTISGTGGGCILKVTPARGMRNVRLS